jgi:hypothetical protein
VLAGKYVLQLLAARAGRLRFTGLDWRFFSLGCAGICKRIRIPQ